MTLVRQVVRGCGNLPHVGSHPGTVWFAALVGVACLQGLNHGMAGAALAGGMMFVAMGAIYFSGAYSRACLSDRLSAKVKT